MSGKATPTAEELQGYEGADGGGHAAASSKGVPYFWLNVLCNQVRPYLLQEQQRMLAWPYFSTHQVKRPRPANTAVC